MSLTWDEWTLRDFTVSVGHDPQDWVVKTISKRFYYCGDNVTCQQQLWSGKCCAPESERRLCGALPFSEVTGIICSFQKPPSNQAHPLCHLEVKLRVSQPSSPECKGKEWRRTEFQLPSSEMQCVNMPHSLSFIWICLPGEKTICHKKIHSFLLINL